MAINNQAMSRMQANAEQRKAKILEENLDSLLHFHQMSKHLTNDDIQRVREFIGACLIEAMAVNLQNDNDDMEDVINNVLNSETDISDTD